MATTDPEIREQLVEIGGVAGLAGVVTGMVEHAHPEPGGPARDGAPDAAESDDAERACADDNCHNRGHPALADERDHRGDPDRYSSTAGRWR